MEKCRGCGNALYCSDRPDSKTLHLRTGSLRHFTRTVRARREAKCLYKCSLQDNVRISNGLPRCLIFSSTHIIAAGSGVGQSNKGGVMLAAIAAVLLVLWLLGFIAFHVTFGAIHLLLVIAVVLFIAHFLKIGRA